MSFLNTVGTIAKSALNSMNEYNAEMQALKQEMEAKSSSELRDIVKNTGFFGSSDKQRKMAYIVLKQRGEV
ncbi:hypothetical protein [Conservatibacter flavescens]|uniref:Uncharacterized protein n=1 Tax=Conservatibacter flavescens TaxID=28161 RepID=A0A2M8S142_9PAST|nr:hypothetical protein [Conservatibacter flavescens]PJG84869.1 hypothetical protein CVP05_08510 [Conservatibacter flavescens]